MRSILIAAAVAMLVSLFITPLAYSEPGLVDGAKIGILAGSVIAALIGVAILAPGGRHPTREREARSSS